jgi:hypothetical protein
VLSSRSQLGISVVKGFRRFRRRIEARYHNNLVFLSLVVYNGPLPSTFWQRALESGRFKSSEVRMLDYCRLLLDVTTISDVTIADGKDVDRTMFRRTPSLFASQIKLMQAEQAKPYGASWMIWCRVLRLWIDWRGRFHQPLIRWLRPGTLLGRPLTSYLSKRTKHLILAKQGVYQASSTISRHPTWHSS